jgi:flagellar hook assembly protein FlgD
MEAVDRRGNSMLDPTGAPDSLYSFMVTAVGIEQENPDAVIPKSFSLSQNFPNPFNPSTEMQLVIPGDKEVRVSLIVYDLHGKLIVKLMDGARAPGIHRIHWDGKDAHGLIVPSGVYFYRMKAGEFTATRKMTSIH